MEKFVAVKETFSCTGMGDTTGTKVIAFNK
jgi:hypothetical protein